MSFITAFVRETYLTQLTNEYRKSIPQGCQMVVLGLHAKPRAVKETRLGQVSVSIPCTYISTKPSGTRRGVRGLDQHHTRSVVEKKMGYEPVITKPGFCCTPYLECQKGPMFRMYTFLKAQYPWTLQGEIPRSSLSLSLVAPLQYELARVSSIYARAWNSKGV
jgi:hypothetical protein